MIFYRYTIPPKFSFLFIFTIYMYSSQNIIAQVGIATTNPKGQLDIVASNQSNPTNTDGILIPRVDAFPSVSPTADQQSMLVYLTTTVGTKSPGFYYWDNTIPDWEPLKSSDADWYKESLTSAPDDINDDVYTQGNVAIGKTVSNYPLDIFSSTRNIASYIEVGDISGFSGGTITGYFKNSNTNNNSQDAIQALVSSNSTGVQTGIRTVLSGNGASGVHQGVFNSMSGTGSGDIRGVMNDIGNTGDGEQTGIFTDIDNDGNGQHTGVYSQLTGSGNGDRRGNSTVINGSGNGNHYGSIHTLNSSGSGVHYGLRNLISGIGTGEQFGVQNNISHTGIATQYGVFNLMSGNNGTATKYGIRNLIGTAGDGERYGTFNELNGTASGSYYGTYNEVTGSGSGVGYGLYNKAIGTGTGNIYGSYTTVSSISTTTNDKYGVVSIIDNTTSGKHYAIHATALSTNDPEVYAGYFVGKVSFGNATDRYIFPTEDGTAGQVLVTDGTGTLTWQNASGIASLTLTPIINNLEVENLALKTKVIAQEEKLSLLLKRIEKLEVLLHK